MFSAAKLRGQLEPAFCMVCGLSEGRNRWLKASESITDGSSEALCYQVHLTWLSLLHADWGESDQSQAGPLV